MPGRERIAAIINILAAVLLAGSVTMMTVQLFRRTVLNAPMTWAEEVVRYSFVWAVYLGSVLALIRDSHIRVLVVVEHFGKTGRVWSDRLTRLVNLIVCAYLFYWSVDLAWKYRTAEFYTLPGVPQVIFYLSVPVSTGLMLFFLFLPDQAGPHHDLPSAEL
jgi:TRAP-type C4-dicarboxylate transport system permease small subunit